MKLKIPKSDAIRIIQNRLKDLDAHDFDQKVWKDRTILDLKQIFPTYNQWLQVSNIQFDTLVVNQKVKILGDGKATAKKLLNAYIDHINEYSAIQETKEQQIEESYEEKYKNLLIQWNDLVPKYNELLTKYDDSLDTIIILSDQVEQLELQIKEVESNDDYFPFILVENTRGYLENIAKQAISSYQNGLFDGCLVLTRKLLEGLIIECYEKHSISTKVKDANGNYFYLSDLISSLISENSWSVSRNSKQAFPEIKKFADLAAHNRRFNATKSDVDKIKNDVRVVIEELVHLSEIKRVNP